MSSIISDVELKSHIEQTIIDNKNNNRNLSYKKLRFRTYKNLLVLCLAFLLQFTAFSAIGNLQSSLNTEESDNGKRLEPVETKIGPTERQKSTKSNNRKKFIIRFMKVRAST